MATETTSERRRAAKPGLTIHPQLAGLAMPLSGLTPDPKNARRHDERNIEAIIESLREHGQRKPVVAQRTAEGTLIVRAGNGTVEAARRLGASEVAVVIVEEGDAEAGRYALRDNRTAELASWDDEQLLALLDELEGPTLDIGWTDAEVERIRALLDDDGERRRKTASGALAREFLMAPFSVLNAREGAWQDRKRSWIDLGIESEVGRGDNLLNFSDAVKLQRKRAPGQAMPTIGGGDALSALLRASGGPRPGGGGSRKPVPERDGGYKGGDAWIGGAQGSRARGHTASLKGGLVHGTTTGPYDGRAPQAGGEASRTGTSIFDPVLCELLISWFSPRGGRVLDPFAGGSVRGIVSWWLGRSYVGVELRPEQVEANRAQAIAICGAHTPRTAPEAEPAQASAATSAEPADWPVGTMTPIVAASLRAPGLPAVPIMVKRDDLFAVAGVQGGKVRTCWALAQGAKGLVTAGSRASPQVNIVAHIARRLGIPCRVHTPQGQLSPEVEAAQAAGAEVVQHKAGYNNVIIARAREDAAARGWTEIPFGMECAEAVQQTRAQVPEALPEGVRRLVIPVGSGMSLAGVLHGLRDRGLSVPVLGIVVGADPSKRLDRYAPEGWRELVQLTEAGSDYHKAAQAEVELAGGESVVLDPHYEAKCAPHMREGDALWVVGVRQTAVAEQAAPQAARSPAGGAVPSWIEGDALDVEALAGPDAFDFVLTCPPYADLEVYSEDPRDISTMEYPEFREALGKAIEGAARLLAEDRFFAIVVGEVREKAGSGAYRGFVPDTIRLCEEAGLRFYNEIILVTAVGSLPVRVRRAFTAARKIGKTHQNVLVFVKGSAERATQACGPVKIGAIVQTEAEGGEGLVVEAGGEDGPEAS